MWFRNLAVYRLAKAIDSSKLETALAARPFTPCNGLDWFSEGWESPAHHIDTLSFARRETILITLGREDKQLSPAIINTALDDKIAKIEAEEHRKVGRKEKLALKEQIADDLLPRAFVKRSRRYAYIDNDSNLLIVDSASVGKAETLLSNLREALPPLPAAVLRTHEAPRTKMTDWLAAGEADGDFVLDSDATLQDGSENGGKVKISRMDLTTDEIRQHIATGKQVTELGLIWRERIRFTLTDSIQLKKVQYLDVLQEEASQAGDDLPSLYEATFLLMSEELRELIESLIHQLGGLALDETPPAAVAGS